MAERSKNLRQLVIELEELGRKSGLSETDVKRCSESALQADLEARSTAENEKLANKESGGRSADVAGNIKLQSRQVGASSNQDKKKRSSSHRCVRIAVWCVIAVIACYCALPLVQKSRYLRGLAFDFLRLIRRETLDIHSKYDVSCRCISKHTIVAPFLFPFHHNVYDDNKEGVNQRKHMPPQTHNVN